MSHARRAQKKTARGRPRQGPRAARGFDTVIISPAPAPSNPAAERAVIGAMQPMSYRFAGITSAAIAGADYRPTWLLLRLLVKDQPKGPQDLSHRRPRPVPRRHELMIELNFVNEAMKGPST